MSPTIYKQWDLLRNKILRLEANRQPIRDDKNRALVFQVAMLSYDPKFPILDDKFLSKWIGARGSDPKQDVKDIEVTSEIQSCSKAATTVPATTTTTTTKITATTTPSTRDSSPESEVSRPHSHASFTEPTAVCRGSIDALIIKEGVDDEFAKYDLVEEVETLQSKNLKKIRAQQPPAPIQKPPVVVRAKTPEPMVKITPEPEKDLPPKVPVIVEPNWPETTKLLKENRLVEVFKDLYHFKIHIKKDQAPRALLKEAVIRCFTEDETVILSDLMSLLFECDYSDDFEFWKEIIMRLKRKLVSHSDVRKFKTNMDPQRVHDNYKRIIASIGSYACSVDLELKLPFHTMKFFLESMQPDTKPKAEVPMQAVKDPMQVVKAPMLKGDDPGCEEKVAPPELPPSQTDATKEQNSIENVDPEVERDVVMMKNSKGKWCFKVRRKMTRNKALSTSNNL